MSPFMKLSSYVLALRPWSLSASLIPVLLACVLAQKVTGEFSVVTVVMTAGTVLSVHAAGNVVNTYFDYVKGIDHKKSDDRTLVDHLLSKEEIATLGALLYMIGCVGFLVLIYISPAKMEHLALVYFGGLSSSFLYTGGIGLKYIALGDVLIMTLFGPISVLFCYMALTGQVLWASIYYAIPLALNTEAILHSNNTRDLDADKEAGIVTIAILIGHTASCVLFALLLFSPYIIFTAYSLHYSKWLALPIITLPAALRIEKEFRSHSMQKIPKKTAKLSIFLGMFYITAIALSDVKDLPFF